MRRSHASRDKRNYWPCGIAGGYPCGSLFPWRNNVPNGKLTVAGATGRGVPEGMRPARFAAALIHAAQCFCFCKQRAALIRVQCALNLPAATSTFRFVAMFVTCCVTRNDADTHTHAHNRIATITKNEHESAPCSRGPLGSRVLALRFIETSHESRNNGILLLRQAALTVQPVPPSQR